MRYCQALNRYQRRQTVAVKAGNVTIGGDNPIRIQSMANTDTNNTEASAAQAKRIADAGGELVRFTAQGRPEAGNLKNIRDYLRKMGCNVPLVADIHFNPEAAFIAAENVEKVRINPGNFIDKRADFSVTSFSDEQYAAELERLKEKFIRLLNICKANGTTLRIGVNHGSLSDRIMTRYGDNPEGMVESAMEFLRICQTENFDQVVLSMKSSNVLVMIHAYRLLTATMEQEGMHYPLHLGVTEAGDGEDARVKSAVGIGALLADGLGDTIRVSLTEAPENEIPVARKLVDYFTGRENHEPIAEVDESVYDPLKYKRRLSAANGNIGENQVPVVVAPGQNTTSATTLQTAPDYFAEESVTGTWIHLNIKDLTPEMIARLNANEHQVIVVETDNRNGAAEQRAFFLTLEKHKLRNPVIIKRNYGENELESLQIKASADLGLLLADGFGDGIWIENKNTGNNITTEQIVSLGFAILQATRTRISKVEYIACPGCGRTLFGLQETLARIKAKTGHLKGLKIGVMGCIVNGPGEMADADFGYVGAGPGRVTLYEGKTVMKRNIPEKEAIDELIALIKERGRWTEPE